MMILIFRTDGGRLNMDLVPGGPWPDVVFMGFWLSHVPAGRFGPFWALVAAALAPHGRVFFADDGYRSSRDREDRGYKSIAGDANYPRS